MGRPDRRLERELVAGSRCGRRAARSRDRRSGTPATCVPPDAASYRGGHGAPCAGPVTVANSRGCEQAEFRRLRYDAHCAETRVESYMPWSPWFSCSVAVCLLSRSGGVAERYARLVSACAGCVRAARWGQHGVDPGPWNRHRIAVFHLTVAVHRGYAALRRYAPHASCEGSS